MATLDASFGAVESISARNDLGVWKVRAHESNRNGNGEFRHLED